MERSKKLGSIYSDIRYRNEVRCDLHPRWNYDSTMICIDAAPEKKRQVYMIPIGSSYKSEKRGIGNENMVEDKVSVIVPIYNVEPYLRRCLDSLVIQKHKNIEILMVDDCSTDGSVVIAKEYAEKYPQFRLVQREKNGGASATRNTGLKSAVGDWIAVVDSDDWVTEEYVSAMYEVAERDNADIVMSSRYYYYPNTRKTIEVSPFSDLTTESSQQEKVALCTPSATARLFRKNFIDSTGIVFPEDIPRSEETVAVIPWLTITQNVSIIRRPMYYYFQRPDSLSNKCSEKEDISFLPKAIRRMTELSLPGFEEELDF